MKILIANDDSLNRKCLRALLISRGLSDEIPLAGATARKPVLHPRADRVQHRFPGGDQSRAMHPDLAIVDTLMPKLPL